MLPKDFTPTIKRYDTLESTNTRLKELALEGAHEGTVVVAEKQTAGRGRGSRVWHSPTGGLYFSVVLLPKEYRRVTDLPILAGVALAQAVKELLPKSVEVTVKWPNDCLVNWKKVGGILCEVIGTGGGGACVVGMGVNINATEKDLESFKTNPFGATSCALATGGGTYETEKVFQMILKKLFTLYHVYHDQGFQPVQYLWEKNCQFIGKKIELRESGWRDQEQKPEGNEVGVTTGTFLGIDEHGALVLSNPRGERRSYVTGEITCFWP